MWPQFLNSLSVCSLFTCLWANFLICYSTVQYSIVQYSTVQYSAVQRYKCTGNKSGLCCHILFMLFVLCMFYFVRPFRVVSVVGLETSV